MAAVEDLKKGVWYARRELENLSSGRSVRGVVFRTSQSQSDREDQVSGAYQKPVHDSDVFFSEEASLRSHDGSGDVCFASTGRHDCVAPQRGSAGQQGCESRMGVLQRQHCEEKAARNGAAWGPSQGGEIDRRAGALGEDMRPVGIKGRGCRRCLQGASQPHTPWAELAAYLAYETEAWRRAAVYGLAVGSIDRAIQAIEQEIDRLNQ